MNGFALVLAFKKSYNSYNNGNDGRRILNNFWHIKRIVVA